MSAQDDGTVQKIARAYGVPMSMIDGRPWVAREDEQPDDPDEDALESAE